MNAQALVTLEFPKILDRLASHTAFSASRELALSLNPSADPIEVARRLRQTTEARHLLNIKPNVGLGGARDVRPSVQRAALGGVLDPSELLEIQSTLASSRLLRGIIVRLRDEVPELADLAQVIVERPLIEDEVGRCITERGDVRDSASPMLSKIRSELKVAHQRLIEKLNDIITSSAYRPYLQEALVTVREGRYVVPVRSEARGQLRGIVHDQSSSGATLFVEPLITVDLNNHWRELQIEEMHEVERILRELSGYVASSAAEIAGNIVSLADIDLCLAKAHYANATNSIEPELAAAKDVGEQSALRFVKARHPLLSGKVVPIDARLGDDFTVLVITGPNTGGKTVALKTVGLLSLMAQAGLHLPTAEGSRARVFERIYADIGDEQSIEQSLSTFSSHMRRVVEISREAGPGCLVLLDEVGAGTDPTEGSALARAILSHLLARGAWVVATTHYSELKAYAHNTAGVQNASVEFDVETLSPTFRLSIGLPGRSNALAIATRLGLTGEIIESARALVSPDDQQVETLLMGIAAEHERAAEALAAAERERRHAEEIRQVLTRRVANIERERDRAIAQARGEAEAELVDLRDRLRKAAALLERSALSRHELLPVAQELRDAERELRQLPVPARRAAARQSREDGKLKVGDAVLVRSLGQVGRVASLLDDRQVEVQLGNFKLRVGVDDLEKAKKDEVSEAAARPSPMSYSTTLVAERSAPLQLDLRGYRAEEVISELDRYLDDAFLAGLPYARIVHGKGSGVLRQVVREFLAGHPLVNSFETAAQKEGGEGVTIVKLGR